MTGVASSVTSERTFARVWTWVQALPAPVCVAMLFAVLMIKVGTWVIPNIEMSTRVSQNLHGMPFDDPLAQYIVWNWLGPAIAHLVHATTVTRYIALHYVFLAVAFFGYLAVLLQRCRRDARDAHFAALLFFCMPVAASVWYWVGMDALTFGTMAALVLSRKRPIASLLLAIALGMNHFEQGLVAFVLLLVASTLAQRSGEALAATPRWCLLVLSGIVAGKVLLIAWFTVNALMPHDRTTWTGAYLPILVRCWVTHPDAIVYSILGVGWIVAAMAWSRIPRLRSALVVPLVMAIALTVVVGDETRVAALVVFPMMHFILIENPSVHQIATQHERGVLTIAFVVVPWIWCWGGIPQSSAFGYDVAFIRDLVTGVNHIGTGAAAYLAPFVLPH